MLHETKELNMDYAALGIAHEGSPAAYTTYLHDIYPQDQNIAPRPLIIICPGGGYNHLSKREGEAVALKMCSLGMNAVILHYSVAPNEYPCALYELATLTGIARRNAAAWNIDPDKIVAAGFSAGAHLAACLGTMWTEAFLSQHLGLTPSQIQPNKLLLCYPVITSGAFAHNGSFDCLLGSRRAQLNDELSLEKRVNASTPEAFIWHTCEDSTVFMENSLLFASALRKAGIRFELHIFPNGAHGMALATEETNDRKGNKVQPECAVWPELFAAWLKNNT
jgi:acetyl esterase/lipase